MPAIKVFQGGTVQRQGLTQARQQGQDYGPSAMEVGLKEAGKALSEGAEQLDQIEDINATIEAQRLALEHGELVRGLGQRVKQSIGENAEPAVNEAISDLDKQTAAILASASPRAQQKLHNDIAQRSALSKDNWLDHGFGEKKVAFAANTKARLTTIAEDANDEDDEGRALTLLSQARGVLDEQARFFGKSAEEADLEGRAYTSDFFKSRALKKAAGDNGSASAAIEYATANRQYMTDDAYNAVLTGYDDAATDERVSAEVNGEHLPSATAGTVEVRDPLAPDAAPQVTRRLDTAAFIRNWVLPTEGGYGIDNDGAEVNMGINGRAHPNENIKGMTQARATQIYNEKYVGPSGAANLPPALAAVHLDTFIMGPAMARKALSDSGGDVDAYMASRQEYQAMLGRKDPSKWGPQVQKAWANRNRNIMAFADRQGGDGSFDSIPIAINTSMRSVEEKVMARTDVGLKYKRKLIGAYRDKQAAMVQERSQQESEASRIALAHAMSFGDNFTSLKQLPPNVVAALGPSGVQTFTNMAKSNKESKPISTTLAAEIGFVSAFSPEKLADPKLLARWGQQGVKPSQLVQFAQAGGKAIADKAKPGNAEALAGSTLLSIARPHLLAAGINLSTLDESAGDKNKDAKPAERKRDAERQLQVINYLGERQAEWRAVNPGKTPPEDVIRKWVGWSILKTRDGHYGFEASDNEIYTNLSAAVRERLRRSLYGNGPMPSIDQRVRDIVDLHQKEMTLSGR